MKKGFIFDIPGAWYGNEWIEEVNQGNIVVDPTMIDQALTWLKRRVNVLSTDLLNDGIVIVYTKRR